MTATDDTRMTLAEQSAALMSVYYRDELPNPANLKRTLERAKPSDAVPNVGTLWFCPCGTLNQLKEFVCSQCKGAKCPVTI